MGHKEGKSHLCDSGMRLVYGSATALSSMRQLPVRTALDPQKPTLPLRNIILRLCVKDISKNDKIFVDLLCNAYSLQKNAAVNILYYTYLRKIIKVRERY